MVGDVNHGYKDGEEWSASIVCESNAGHSRLEAELHLALYMLIELC